MPDPTTAQHDFALGADPAGPPDKIKLTFVEHSRIEMEITPDEARHYFGLGGTGDEYLGSAIWALAERRPSILARAARDASGGTAYHWILSEVTDPWNW